MTRHASPAECVLVAEMQADGAGPTLLEHAIGNVLLAASEPNASDSIQCTFDMLGELVKFCRINLWRASRLLQQMDPGLETFTGAPLSPSFPALTPRCRRQCPSHSRRRGCALQRHGHERVCAMRRAHSGADPARGRERARARRRHRARPGAGGGVGGAVPGLPFPHGRVPDGAVVGRPRVRAADARPAWSRTPQRGPDPRPIPRPQPAVPRRHPGLHRPAQRVPEQPLLREHRSWLFCPRVAARGLGGVPGGPSELPCPALRGRCPHDPTAAPQRFREYEREHAEHGSLGRRARALLWFWQAFYSARSIEIVRGAAWRGMLWGSICARLRCTPPPRLLCSRRKTWRSGRAFATRCGSRWSNSSPLTMGRPPPSCPPPLSFRASTALTLSPRNRWSRDTLGDRPLVRSSER